MTKRTRRLLCPGLLALVGLLSLGVWWLAAPRHRITKAGFDALRDGMTRAEIEAALGAPPGVYYSGRLLTADPPEEDGRFFFPCAPEDRAAWAVAMFRARDARSVWFPETTWAEWTGPDAVIFVHFDERGRAVARDFLAVRPAPEPLPAKLRRWLRL